MTPNVIRCFCYIFVFVSTYFHLACLVVMARSGNWVAMACLLPSHMLVVGIEVYCALQDRDLAQLRRKLKNGCCRVAVFEAAVVIVGGLLFGYPLVRAYRCLKERDKSFLDEIEQSAAGLDAGAQGLRFDTHAMLVSDVPRVVVLTNRLISAYWTGPEVFCICSAVAMTLVNVVQAVANFDYYASRYIRGQYDLCDLCCDQQCLPYHILLEFRTAHYVYRLAEILSRTLVLVAVALVFKVDARLGIILLLSDYLLGLVALRIITGSKLILVLSIDIFVANVCRFIDEHGMAMQAQRVSRFLWALRNAQFWLAAGLYYHYALQPNETGALEGNGAKRLLIVGMSAQFTTFVFLRFTKVGNESVDFFLAAKRGDIEALEDILRAGCDPDIRQGDSHNETAMHVAVSHGQVLVLQALLEHRADARLLNDNDETPLHIACRRGDIDAIELLVQPLAAGGPERTRAHGRQSAHADHGLGGAAGAAHGAGHSLAGHSVDHSLLAGHTVGHSQAGHTLGQSQAGCAVARCSLATSATDEGGSCDPMLEAAIEEGARRGRLPRGARRP
ncbi:unnamed protein product, partial [Prorocentrum cordatum]